MASNSIQKTANNMIVNSVTDIYDAQVSLQALEQQLAASEQNAVNITQAFLAAKHDLAAVNQDLTTTRHDLITAHQDLTSAHHDLVELTDAFEDSTAYTAHLHEQVAVLTEQLRGLNEHHHLQYLVHQQRQTGFFSHGAPQRFVATKVPNPNLSCNNPLIMNDRLRTTILSLRAEIRSLIAEKEELEGEVSELQDGFLHLNEAPQVDEGLLRQFPAVPVEVLEQFAAVLQGKEREIAALKVRFDRELKLQ